MNVAITAILNSLPALIEMFGKLVTAILKAYNTANQEAVSDTEMQTANDEMNKAYAEFQAELQSHVKQLNQDVT